MPHSPTGRYCDSPPRSPRHYDKYTYSSRRRPEEAEESVPRSPGRSDRRFNAYEACVAGVAPLNVNADGFAVAEDGTVQSRFISAPRYSAPSIAMVPVPMAVMPRAADASPSGSAHASRVLMSPPTREGDVPSVPYAVGVSEVVPSSEVEAWKRLVMVAGRDFKEDELAALNWETLTELMTHYKIANPIDIARIQLAWKRRQGLLPSDNASTDPLVAGPIVDETGALYTTVPTLVRYPNARPSPSRVSAGHATVSPRRDSPRRFVPGYKQRQQWDHVSPKVDTGRRTPTRGGASPSRTRTPTRRL